MESTDSNIKQQIKQRLFSLFKTQVDQRLKLENEILQNFYNEITALKLKRVREKLEPKEQVND